MGDQGHLSTSPPGAARCLGHRSASRSRTPPVGGRPGVVVVRGLSSFVGGRQGPCPPGALGIASDTAHLALSPSPSLANPFHFPRISLLFSDLNAPELPRRLEGSDRLRGPRPAPRRRPVACAPHPRAWPASPAPSSSSPLSFPLRLCPSLRSHFPLPDGRITFLLDSHFPFLSIFPAFSITSLLATFPSLLSVKEGSQ